jgi:hypothetical protein
MSFLDNYEDVATRIKRFWETHPSGKIHTSITDIDLVAGYVLVECRVYREFEDHEPSAIDFAYGNVSTFNAGMKKWFVEDTVTSAIGRAVGLVLGMDKRPTAQNMAQVEQPSEPKAVVWDAQEPEDPWTTHTTTHNTTEPTPRCTHGSRVWKTGEKNGKAWAHYKCQEANRENQCAPIWYVVGSDGKWKPQA